MVENIAPVRDTYVERPRPPEPQERPEPRPQQAADGDPTPPNRIALLADRSSAELLRVQEVKDDEYGSADEFIRAADTSGDRAIQREEFQKIVEKNQGEQSADDSAAAERAFTRMDADRDGSLNARELDASRARAINIGA